MIRLFFAIGLSLVLYMQTTDAKFADFMSLHVKNTAVAVYLEDEQYFIHATEKAVEIAFSASELLSAKQQRESKSVQQELQKIAQRAPESLPAPRSKAEAKYTAKLGGLSERYESNGKPGAIGRDSTGGPSYGSYQIATYTGTFAKWMQWLKQNHQAYYAELQRAGGNKAARQGASRFKAKWRELARQKGFQKAQHEFIADSHYMILARRVKPLGIDLSRRSHALRDVAWSTAVQHGGGTNIFHRCRKHARSDKAMINCVYSIRPNYFKRSTAAVQRAVKNRFRQEHKQALAMLRSEQG